MADSAMRPDNLRFELVPESAPETPAESPLRLAHRALRGRYRYALILAGVFAAVCSLAGYNAVPPKYTSTGLVHIEAALPTILYETEESQVPPMFDAYVAGQTAFLRSGQILAAAIERPELIEAGWPSGPEGVSELSQALTVSRPRGEHTISVTVTHRDAHQVHAAVNAILAAYAESDPDPSRLSLDVKERVLVQRERNLETQLETLRMQILEASGQYGHDAVERMHAGKVDELMTVDRKIEQIRLTRRNVEAGMPLDATGAGVGPGGVGGDSRITQLRDEELALQAEVESLPYAPGHPAIRKLERQIEAIRIQVQLRQQVRSDPAAGDAGADPDALVMIQLDRLEAGYAAMRDTLREEAATLGRRRIVLSGLGEKVEGIQDRLSMTRSRLDEVRFEAGRENADRLTIVAGALPGLPSRDRRAGLAGAGAMFGAGSAIALVALIGLLERRIRYVDELEALKLPVTIVPGDPDRLRQSMQLRRNTAGTGTIHAIASCDLGEAGAELAHALAVSFATAGYRTLLVDSDFVSARLSRGLDVTERPGLRDGIKAGDGRGAIHPTQHDDLWVMPVGTPGLLTQKDLSRETIRRLYDDLRTRFDAVVVDAGVVPCEFDACLVTAEADEVVLQALPGQQRQVVQATVEQVGRLGIVNANLVFGRASVPGPRADGAASSRTTSPVAGVIGKGERKRAA